MKNLKKSTFVVALAAVALSFSLNLTAAPTTGNPVADTTKMAKKKMDKMKMKEGDKMKMKEGEKMKNEKKMDKMKMKKDSSKMGKM